MSNLPAFLRQLAAGAMHYSSAGLQATANAFEALEAEVKELENQLEAEKQGHRTHAARLIGERGQLRNRAEEAEAELARLKAQDPVAYTDAEQLRELRKSTFAEIYTPHESHKTDAEWIPLYAEPRPAVLPPEILALIERLKPEYGTPGSRDIDVTAKRNAIDKVIDDALALGCQPQRFVVELKDCDIGAVQHMSGGNSDYCKGFVDGTQNAIRQIAKAGGEIAE